MNFIKFLTAFLVMFGMNLSSSALTVVESSLSLENRPTGDVSLRLILQINGPTYKKEVLWKITTYHKNKNYRTVIFEDILSDGFEMTLPAGWYIAEATLANGASKRLSIEVTEGLRYDYTLLFD